MNDDSMEAISSRFEAVKIAMAQDKNGHVLKLSIHPNDTPEDLMRDMVGQRYMVVMVRMNDQNEPVASEGTQEGLRAIKVAGAMCGDERFQSWLVQIGMVDGMSEEAAAEGVRRYCGVTSRSEFKINRQARDKFFSLRDEFVAALNRGRVL